jgi:hypothetical protein
LLEVWKSDWSPNTRVTNKSHERKCTSHEKRGDKESPKVWARLKSCESLYTCPRAPFYRETRDFYIPRLPSNKRNISNVNTYKNVFYIPWFAGLISYINKSATSSHFKPELLKRHLWLDFFLTPKLLFMKIITHCDSRIETTRFPNFADSWFPELRQFPTILKWTADSRTEA